jgi:hypothetical protein
MKRFEQVSNEQSVNVIRRVTFAVLFASAFLLQTNGRVCTGSLLGVFTSGGSADAESSWGGQGGDAAGTSWAGAEDGLHCDALLPEHRSGFVVVFDTLRFVRTPDVVWSRYHDNMRPPLRRARAGFCNFSSLRNILHPHFFLLAHTSPVLC